MTPQQRIENLSVPEPNSGCWLWLGAVRGEDSLKQYGHLTVGSRKNGTRKTVSAHRYSYQIFCGVIPDGLQVCHSCDTPACVNPFHLFIGSRMDNVRDRQSKGRNRSVVGSANPNAKINETIARDILRLRRAGSSPQQIAAQTEASVHIVKDVLSKRSWGFVLPDPPKPGPKGRKR